MTRAVRRAIGAGAVAALALVACARGPEEGAAWRFGFVAVHLGASWALVTAARTVRLSRRDVLVGAVLFRLIALPLLPSLSDDGFRYLWDGRVTVSGVSPYRYQPQDPALDALRAGEEYGSMNSPAYYSVYPPGSQAAFAIATVLSPDVDWRARWWTWKALMVIAELVAVVGLLSVADPSRVVLYAWSPLAVIEIAGQGHTEALVLLGLAAVLAAPSSRLPLRSLGATVAGLVKLYPLALLPVTWRRDGVAGVAASVIVALALTAAVWSPGAWSHVSASLGLFFGTFDEYAAPYLGLKALLYPVAQESAGRAASGLLGAAYVCAVVVRWASDDGSRRSLTTAVVWVAVGFTLAASTLHPWYWLPVLFLCPLLRSKTPSLWLNTVASGTYLDYVVPGTGLVVTVVGWGGAAWWLYRARSQDSASNRESGVADRASSHTASG